jgi:hypothetical protein
MRMGAEIPRYRRENLNRCNLILFANWICGLPFLLDYFSETVDHAIVPVVSHGSMVLELARFSCQLDVEGIIGVCTHTRVFTTSNGYLKPNALCYPSDELLKL